MTDNLKKLRKQRVSATKICPACKGAGVVRLEGLDPAWHNCGKCGGNAILTGRGVVPVDSINTNTKILLDIIEQQEKALEDYAFQHPMAPEMHNRYRARGGETAYNAITKTAELAEKLEIE